MSQPAAPETPQVDALRERLDAINQSHLLTFYDELDDAQQRTLLNEIAALDLDRLPTLIDEYVRNKPSFELDPTKLREPDVYDLDGDWDRAHFEKAGAELLRAGRVAAFTVAGGQGSRLGYDGPKGEYPAGAVTGKPLFACQAEWVQAAGRRFGATPPWYIMTSPLNHERTVAFFKDNHYFGLNPDDVKFFSQGVMPSIDMRTGKLLLADKHRLATNPDGHGGSLKALFDSGATEDMRARGVEHISYVQVDNPIVRIIDPVFIGLHAHADDSSAEMSSKMIPKAGPLEKVGLFAKIDGKTQVIEYSDLPDELAHQTTDTGRLKYHAGSIAIHAIGVGFVEKLNEGGSFSLPFHRAEKKVPHVDLDTGERIEPTEPNAVKLETFVFDAIPLAGKSIVYETERVDEFAPIKNKEGNDSPQTCARIQTERAARMLEEAGVGVPRTDDGEPDCTIELSPLTAMHAGDLDADSIEPIKPGEKRAL